MAEHPEPPEPPPTFLGACKELAKEHLPFGLKAFLPWVQSEADGIRRGWVFFIFISLALVTVTIVAVWKLRVSPLEDKLSKMETAKNSAEQKLAPFWAAGDRYFSNAPSAERLAVLLNTLTNSAADIRELKDLQNRTAKLNVWVVGEGSGFGYASGPVTPSGIVYVPLFNDKTNVGLHFVVENRGELPAEIIHAAFFCPTQQLLSAPQWEDQTSYSEAGEKQLLSKIDAIYPGSRYILGAIKFSGPVSGTLSTSTRLFIEAKNSVRVHVPLELFFFPSRTNIAPFFSTNRLVWHDFAAF